MLEKEMKAKSFFIYLLRIFILLKIFKNKDSFFLFNMQFKILVSNTCILCILLAAYYFNASYACLEQNGMSKYFEIT